MGIWNDLNIGTKFGVFAGAFALLAVGIAYMGISSLHQLNETTDQVLRKDLGELGEVGEDVESLLKENEWEALLPKAGTDLSAILDAKRKEAEEKQKILTKLDRAKKLETLLVGIHGQLISCRDNDNFNRIDGDLKAAGTLARSLDKAPGFQENWKAYQQFAGELLELVKSETDKSAGNNQGDALFSAILDDLGTFRKAVLDAEDPTLLSVELHLYSIQDLWKGHLLARGQSDPSSIVGRIQAAQGRAIHSLENFQEQLPAEISELCNETTRKLEEYANAALRAIKDPAPNAGQDSKLDLVRSKGTPLHEKLLTQTQATLAGLETEYRELGQEFEHTAQTLEAQIRENGQQASRNLASLRRQAAKTTGKLADNVEEITGSLEGHQDEQKEAYAQTRNRIIGITASALFGLSCLGFITFSNLNGRLQRATEVAKEIQAGDLSGRVEGEANDQIGQLAREMNMMCEQLEHKSKQMERIAQGDLSLTGLVASEKDTLGKSMETMVSNLNRFLSLIHDASQGTARAIQDVTASSLSVSDSTQQAASFIQQIQSSVVEIQGKIGDTVKKAQEADSLSTQACEDAQTGANQMAEMAEAMEDIKQSSQEVNKIIKVIDDIAFQTNLLALNAAVEAARAGAHGKGFAVVAEEVRNLAARSAKAARSTTELIESSANKVAKGIDLAKQTSDTFSVIGNRVMDTEELVSDITQALKDQADGISHISQGVSKVEKLIHDNAARALQTTSATDEMKNQADQLQGAVHAFKSESTPSLRNESVPRLT